MTREFLKSLGLEDSTIDSIMAENEKDVNMEKQETVKAKADLSDAQGKLSTAQTELETLRKSNGDVAAVQKQLENLQAKYNKDISDRDAQLADRDYSDAITRSISSAGLKFSSKSAERAFIASAKEAKMELKDGALTGFGDFVNAKREEDPDAFAPEKPVPHFVGSVGSGGAPAEPLPANVAQAKAIGAARASAMKASSDAMKNYM